MQLITFFLLSLLLCNNERNCLKPCCPPKHLDPVRRKSERNWWEKWWDDERQLVRFPLGIFEKASSFIKCFPTSLTKSEPVQIRGHLILMWPDSDRSKKTKPAGTSFLVTPHSREHTVLINLAIIETLHWIGSQQRWMISGWQLCYLCLSALCPLLGGWTVFLFVSCFFFFFFFFPLD